MPERTGLVTSTGDPLTLIGNEIKVGQPAPETELVANDLSAAKLSALRNGKVCVMPKDVMKELLKRSPNKLDALSLTFAPHIAVVDPLDLEGVLE